MFVYYTFTYCIIIYMCIKYCWLCVYYPCPMSRICIHKYAMKFWIFILSLSLLYLYINMLSLSIQLIFFFCIFSFFVIFPPYMVYYCNLALVAIVNILISSNTSIAYLKRTLVYSDLPLLAYNIFESIFRDTFSFSLSFPCISIVSSFFLLIIIDSIGEIKLLISRHYSMWVMFSINLVLKFFVFFLLFNLYIAHIYYIRVIILNIENSSKQKDFPIESSFSQATGSDFAKA